MILFLINLALALIWATVTGSFLFANVLFGFLIAAFVLHLIRRGRTGSQDYLTRSLRIFLLLCLFIKELTNSAIKVALTVLSPRMELKPGFITYEIKLDRDFEITLLANLITLTPGTLSVDVSEDRKLLFIHALDCSDPEGIRADIANGFERRILEAFR